MVMKNEIGNLANSSFFSKRNMNHLFLVPQYKSMNMGIAQFVVATPLLIKKMLLIDSLGSMRISKVIPLEIYRECYVPCKSFFRDSTMILLKFS